MKNLKTAEATEYLVAIIAAVVSAIAIITALSEINVYQELSLEQMVYMHWFAIALILIGIITTIVIIFFK